MLILEILRRLRDVVLAILGVERDPDTCGIPAAYSAEPGDDAELATLHRLRATMSVAATAWLRHVPRCQSCDHWRHPGPNPMCLDGLIIWTQYEKAASAVRKAVRPRTVRS